MRPPSLLLALLTLAPAVCGCATLRVTDPPRTADEQFLQSEAIREAVSQLSFGSLRDRRVYLFTDLLYQDDTEGFELAPEYERLFMVGELRNAMLVEGVALAETPEAAEIIVEVRSGAIGINRQGYVLGVTGTALPIGSLNVGGDLDVPLILPEFAIVRNLKQKGFAAVSITAYWKDTRELVTSSGPFIGRTERTDYWFFGIGPRTSGDIPTVVDE